MGHQDHRFSQLLSHGQEPVLHFSPGDHIQGSKGLVQKKDVRAAEGRSQKGGPLAHPAGKRGRIAVFIPLQTKYRKIFPGPLPHFLQRAVDPSVQAHIVQDGLPGKQKIVLGHIGKMT